MTRKLSDHLPLCFVDICCTWSREQQFRHSLYFAPWNYPLTLHEILSAFTQTAFVHYVINGNFHMWWQQFQLPTEISDGWTQPGASLLLWVAVPSLIWVTLVLWFSFQQLKFPSRSIPFRSQHKPVLFSPTRTHYFLKVAFTLPLISTAGVGLDGQTSTFSVFTKGNSHRCQYLSAYCTNSNTTLSRWRALWLQLSNASTFSITAKTTTPLRQGEV